MARAAARLAGAAWFRSRATAPRLSGGLPRSRLVPFCQTASSTTPAASGVTSRPVSRILCRVSGGGHPSGVDVAIGLVRSTRRRWAGNPPARTAGWQSFSILLRVGFAEPPQSPAVLVVSYTTVSPLPRSRGAVYSLWHFPAGHPGWALPTTLPCGVRTFLDQVTQPRPPGRLVRCKGS